MGSVEAENVVLQDLTLRTVFMRPVPRAHAGLHPCANNLARMCVCCKSIGAELTTLGAASRCRTRAGAGTMMTTMKRRFAGEQ